MPGRTFTLFLILAAGLPAPGATRASAAGDTELARVGDHIIRERDFIQAYENITPENRPDLTTDDARREFLGNLVNRELLFQEAERRGIEADRRYALNWEGTRRSIIEPALEKHVAAKLPAPSTAELSAFKTNLAQRYHFHLLVTTDRPKIESAQQQLEGGRPFAEVEAAWRADEDTEFEDKDTESPEVIPFQLRDPLFQLQPGEWSPVINLRGMYHIIYLESREPLTVTDADVLRSRAESTLRQDAISRGMDAIVAEGRAAADYHVDEVFTRQVARRFRESAVKGERPGSNLEHWPPFTYEDVGRDLATWKTGHLTLDDLLFRLADYPDAARPDLGSVRELVYLRDEFTAEVFRMAEAEKRGVLKEPAVARRLTRLRERRLLRTVRELLVAGATVSDADVRAFYDQHLDTFSAPAEYHVLAIVRADSAGARQCLAELRSGADFADVARKTSIHAPSAAQGGDLGWIGPGSDAHRDLGPFLNRLNRNELSEPVPGLGGWAILMLDDARGKRTPAFDEVKDMVRERLQEEAEDRKLGEWLDAQKKETALTFHEARLAAIKIPKESPVPKTSED